MSKKILVISGSPRKGGNSDTLCDEFIRGAKESGNQTEKIRLSEKKIGYCLGCERCHSNGDVCVQKDDMSEILDKMIAADVIVLATPIYFYTMDAQMKTFIDRTVARYTKITNKEFYFIVTAADTSKKNMNRAIEGFHGFTEDCLDGATEAGILYGVGLWKAGEAKASPFMKEAYEMGKNA